MPNNSFTGAAQAVAQIDTVTIANTWAQNDTITLTINSKSVVVTVGTLVTTAQVATTIKEAWENGAFTDTSASKTPANGGQDIVEHAQSTATVSGSVVTLTRDDAGEPFTLVVTESTAGDGTATEATATAATGPEWYDNNDNWTGPAGTPNVPVAAEDVYVENTAVSIRHGLENAGATLASFNRAASHTGEIGLPTTNVAGYAEYRPQYLEIDATLARLGYGPGTGSGRGKIDFGKVQTAAEVPNTGTSVESGIPALLLKGTNASNTLEVLGGSVGVCFFGDEVATFATINISGGTVIFGLGLTTTTVNMRGASVTIPTDTGATYTVDSGSVTLFGTEALTALVITAGTVRYHSSGTITTATIGGGRAAAVLDCSGDLTARTITTTNLKPDGRIIDPSQTITHTNDIVLDSTVREVVAA